MDSKTAKNKAAFPVIVLMLCIAAFAVLIPVLGFYWDDWFVIFYGFAERADYLPVHYSYDRPYSYWTAILSHAILGTSPILWQIAAILIRWGALLASWWALRALWPRRAKELGWVVLLFAVYPAYFLQPISVALSQHWIAYGLFFVSLGAMGWATRRPERAAPLTLLALATSLGHLLTLEYFAGLELIRPFYLYMIISQKGAVWRQSIKRALLAWSPYAALWAAWVIWRLFLLEFPTEPHPPSLVYAIFENPAVALPDFFNLVVDNIRHLLFGVWPLLLQRLSGSSRNPVALLSLAIGALTAIGVYAAMPTMRAAPADQRPDGHMGLASLGLGLVSALVGLIPIWLIGETSLGLGYNERFALPTMFGAALFWMGVLWLLLREMKLRALVLSIVLGFIVVGHVRAADEFRADWVVQQEYYAQLKWRAPAILPGTAIFIFEPVSNWMPNPSASSAAINTLYSQSRQGNVADYWIFETRRSARVNEIEGGEILERNYRGLQFEAEDADSLLFFYKAADGCLWVLTPLDVHNAYLPAGERQWVASANLSRIQDATVGQPEPPAYIFGDFAPEGWCTYYEKADLARQFGDWEAVEVLMREAEATGLEPNYGIEWRPLLEAYAHRGQWEGARALSGRIHAMDAVNDSMLCAIWDQFLELDLLDDTGREIRRDVKQFAACE